MSINVFVIAYDQTENDLRYKKGYIAQIEEDTIPISRRMCLPQFIVFNVDGITVEQATAYMEKWQQDIKFTKLVEQTSTDGFRIKLYVANASSSGVGDITRDQVEAYLNNWNASIFSTGINEVIFDFYIFDVIKSKGFLEVNNIDDVIWNDNYDSNTGTHIVTANYSSYNWKTSVVESKINSIIDHNYDDVNEDDGIISHDIQNKIIVFQINRETVLRIFKEDIKEKSEKFLDRRIYYIDRNYCDSVINNMYRSNIQSGSGDTFVVLDGSGFSIGDKISLVNMNFLKDFELATIIDIVGDTIKLDTVTSKDYSLNSLMIQRECINYLTANQILQQLRSKLDD